MIFLNVEQVIQIHDDLVSEYGGVYGIRDLGLLISAIETPKATMFCQDLHDSIYDKAAAYLFHIVSNHAFVDGNKRTGAAVALIFLNQNQIDLEYEISEFEELVCQVSQGIASKKEISVFLRTNGKTNQD